MAHRKDGDAVPPPTPQRGPPPAERGPGPRTGRTTAPERGRRRPRSVPPQPEGTKRAPMRRMWVAPRSMTFRHALVPL